MDKDAGGDVNDVTSFEAAAARPTAQTLSGLGDKAFLDEDRLVVGDFTVGALKGTTAIYVTLFAHAPPGGASAFETIGKQALEDAVKAMIAEGFTRL